MNHCLAQSSGVTVCRQCDWLMELPGLGRGESAHCPRCAGRVAERTGVDPLHSIAWSIAALIMLGLSLVFPFVRFQTRGNSHTIVLLDSAAALLQQPYAPVGVAIALCTVVLPGIYLLILIFLSAGPAAEMRLPGMRLAAKVPGIIAPWMMSDVFVVGVLISVVKMVSVAHIELGPSFATFCAYSLLLLVTLSRHDFRGFWRWFAGPVEAPTGAVPGRSAAEQGLAGCSICGAVFDVRRVCPRCGRRPPEPPRPRQPATWALLATASALYFPAMAYPVMTLHQLGSVYPQTIVSGAWYFVQTGSWPIALVIFAASVVVPIGKILALAWLCGAPRPTAGPGRLERTRLYRLTEVVGRWSMIDVFVVAVLAALIQAGPIVSVVPGPGIIAFGAVVVVTMLAVMSFDPRAIWLVTDRDEDRGA